METNANLVNLSEKSLEIINDIFDITSPGEVKQEIFNCVSTMVSITSKHQEEIGSDFAGVIWTLQCVFKLADQIEKENNH